MFTGLFRWLIVALGPTFLVAGCASNGPLLNTGLTAMRTSVAGAKSTSTETFTHINASRRDFTVEDVLDANRAPQEADFAPLIAPDSIKRWNTAFDKIDEYLAALQDLIDSKRSHATFDNLQSIGSGLTAPSIGVTLPKGAEGAFALFGTAVQGAAEAKALDTMHRVDPAFQQLMSKLGDLSSSSDEASLASIVRTQWKRQLDDIAADDYGKAATSGSVDGRAAAIRAYGQALDRRDAKLAALAALRQSLLELGQAHTAAAKGQNGAMLYWIQQIDVRLKEARDRASNAGG
jgi:hypothetical protein